MDKSAQNITPGVPRRRLGQGLEVSAIGLGCMEMSWYYGAEGCDDVTAERLIRRALDLGVTLLDTADMYGNGHNEMLVGHAIRGRRQEAVVATKFGYQRGLDGSDLGFSGKPEYVQRACEWSLRRLGVETIDLYYLHRLDPQTPIEDTVGAMARLVEAGKVRHLGLSEVSAATLRRAHRVHPITALQSEYSLWTRDPEQGVLAVCRELGIGFVPFSPLGRGIFGGKLTAATRLEPSDFRNLIPRFADENLPRNVQMVERLTALAQARGCTPAQLALAWLLAQGPDIVPIPGTKRQKYMEENAAAALLALTPADQEAIAAAVPADAIAGARYTPAGMAQVNL
ncbi:MAG: aldo/keto reductase [Terriglobales bacterium]|jgi:aryl-alcohol dehydrogenase-like predicted oxidoreductase